MKTRSTYYYRLIASTFITLLLAAEVGGAEFQKYPKFRSTQSDPNQKNIDWIAKNSKTSIELGGSCPKEYRCEILVHDSGMLQRELVPVNASGNSQVVGGKGGAPLIELSRLRHLRATA